MSTEPFASIEGAISPAECALLYELARTTADGCIVEVGSYRGKSTAALALGSLAGQRVPVYAIEPHEHFKGVLGGEFGPGDRVEFFKNMLAVGVGEIVRLVNLSSEIVTPGWQQPVGLLWIDGDHRYETVRRDFAGWEPFVISGGLIAFHDSLDPTLGPSQVIESALRSQRFERLRQQDLTTVLRKR